MQIPRPASRRVSQLDHATLPHRPVGREHDPEALDRVVHVVGEVEILLDRPQQKALLARAELVMVRFIGGVEELVLARRLAVRLQRRMVQQNAVGLRCGGEVGGLRARGPSPA